MISACSRRPGLVRIALLLAASVVAAAGCRQSSLLITPVSAKRQLVEQELSRDSWLARDKVALIDVSGIMRNERGLQLWGRGEHPVSLLLEQLDKARRDRLVKGVVLRINSAGGTVVASELMHDEIMHFRKSGKPIVAVMMDMATSGAYYIACACDEILAQPSTITGSIGVVMQTFDISGTMELVGVKADAIISGVFKDSGSPLRSMKPEEREMFQLAVNEMYERFVRVVAAGRSALDETAVRRLADGRVYTAGQAVKEGLVDRIATMRGALDIVKQRVGSKNVRLVAYVRPPGSRANYYAQVPRVDGIDVNLLKVDFPAWSGWMPPQFLYVWAPGLN